MNYQLSFKYYVSLLFLGFILWVGCGTPRESSGPDSYEDLKTIVSKGNFRIENSWANPVGGGNIDIMTNPNHIIFKQDSLNIYLPYFGVRHAGAGKSMDGGIRFKGIPKSLSVKNHPEKKFVQIEFSTENDTENLDFRIQVFANGNTYTSVNSSQRSTISYKGELLVKDGTKGE